MFFIKMFLQITHNIGVDINTSDVSIGSGNADCYIRVIYTFHKSECSIRLLMTVLLEYIDFNEYNKLFTLKN